MAEQSGGGKPDFEARLKALKEQYVAGLPEKLERIRNNWSSLRSLQRFPPDLIQPFREDVHKLAGSGASYGFAALSTLMQRLEHRLDELAEFPEDADRLVVEIDGLIGQTFDVDDPGDHVEAEELSGSGLLPRPELPKLLMVCNKGSGYGLLAERVRLFGFDVLSCPAEECISKYQQFFPELVVYCRESDAPCPGPREFSKSKLPYVFCLESAPDILGRVEAYRKGIREVLPGHIEAAELVKRLENCFRPTTPVPYRVLIVEDDPDQSQKYQETLEKAAMEVRTADSPESLQQVLRDFRPEVILMDLHLGEFNGIELSAAIRQDPLMNEVPIVFVSVATDLNSHLSAIRAGGDGFLTKPVAPLFLIASLESRARRARQLSQLLQNDGLTGLMNHRTTEDMLQRAVARASRSSGELAVVMIDLDHFKQVNDQHGHLMGDRVLVNFSGFLKGRLRRSDILGRYGGEEFLLVLVDTSLSTARAVVESLRVSFSAVNHSDDGDDAECLSVTFSAGIAAYPQFPDSGELIRQADMALYEAKRSGRNRCCIAGANEPKSDSSGESSGGPASSASGVGSGR